MIRMKSIALLSVVLFILTHTLQAQTLFTYGNKSVSKAEFLKAFGKNHAGQNPTDSAYRDYLDLYIKFKIKVQAALDMKLDTLAGLNAELQNFRSQIAQNYLNDEATIQELIDEAFARSQKDIAVAHIFIAAKKEDGDAKMREAQAKTNRALEALKTRSFNDVALEYSDDPSVKANNGNIGYITAFVLPYHMENIIYNTPAGRYSKPFQTAAGFHILKNVTERPAVGRIRVAQILLPISFDATQQEKNLVRAKADSIAEALKNGADFKSLALQFSADNISYQNGGELPEFGVGRYDQVFESAAFALKADGEISKPALTEFGYHIIKRLSHTPAPREKATDKWREDTRQTIMQNDRLAVSQKKVLGSIQQKTNFRMLPYNQRSLWILTDSMLANRRAPQLADLPGNTGLFSFAKQTVRVKDWQNYLESIRNIQTLVSGKTNSELFDQFVETSSLDYYREHLEEFNPDFQYQLNEFKEGNLLFEVMQRKIWDAASQDTIALKNFYQSNQSKYWWENSADAIIFTSANDSIAETVRTALNSNKNWKQLVESSNDLIQADSGRFELGQIPVVDRTNFTEGLITANVKNESDNSVTFAYVIRLYNNRQPRSFQDARGFVINDYQEYLENQWVTSLKKKYPVKINQAVFKSLPK